VPFRSRCPRLCSFTTSCFRPFHIAPHHRLPRS
jgi:hypothetical protein